MIFVENDQDVHKALIYFHANSEDATTSIDLMIELNDNLNVSFLFKSLKRLFMLILLYMKNN